MECIVFDKHNSEMKQMLIIYDISDNRRRTKIAKLFEGYGYRVQESAFEFCINNKRYKKLIKQIDTICKAEDNIRIYPLRALRDEREYRNEMCKTQLYLI